jgi:hypothetical protein
MEEPTLECIWEARRRIYAQCDNDPIKLVQYYMERQKENPERFTSSSTTPSTVPDTDKSVKGF